MKVQLKRTTSLTFDYIDRAGRAQTKTIPGVTVGLYREALLLEVEIASEESPEQVQARLVQQCKILCGERDVWGGFVDQLDPTQVSEVISALLAVYAGMDPEALIETQRSLKKKMLLTLLLPRQTGSTTATS